MRFCFFLRSKQIFAAFSAVCLFLSLFVFSKLVKRLDSNCGNQPDPARSLLSQKAIEILRSYNFERDRTKHKQRDDARWQEKVEVDLAELNQTDYFDCDDFKKMPDTYQVVKENIAGNRGISFVKINIEGRIIDVVFKEGTKFFSTIGDEYKYNSAKKEIEYLTKLNGLPGIPRLFGSCIEKSYIGYFVERIKGKTMCKGNGTTMNCSNGIFLLDSIAQSKDPKLSALKIAFTSSRLFKLLEERHLFLEDLSGINLMFDTDFDVYLVDADSLIFYNRKRFFDDDPTISKQIQSMCACLKAFYPNDRCTFKYVAGQFEQTLSSYIKTKEV